MINHTDTICALATPPGIAGLAVIRVSGPDAVAFVDSLFAGSKTLTQAPSKTVLIGWWNVSGGKIDEVTVVTFRQPHSYTGEDVVEVGCHGGPFVVSQILDSLVNCGARPAAPGEFTRRAFLNNKLDLTQVEAVADLIHSQSILGAQTAARQLAGGFTSRLSDLRTVLLSAAGLLEVELDFSEDEYEFVSRSGFAAALRDGCKLVAHLISSASTAQILRSGYYVSVVGYPNAGKSSLFNALLGRRRAIVSHIPGTTRDYLEESLIINGYTIHLVDTAGLRDTKDTIELEGIRITSTLIEQSNLVLVVNDATTGLGSSDALLEQLTSHFSRDHVPMIIVQNKMDVLSADKNTWQQLVPDNQIPASTVTENGLNYLINHIVTKVSTDASSITDVLVNARQTQLLGLVSTHLLSALNALDTHQPADLIAIDVRAAIRLLGEITGETWNPDVLDTVFSRFCIGK